MKKDLINFLSVMVVVGFLSTVATLTVAQEAAAVVVCSYSISETSETLGPAEQVYVSLGVTATSGCTWVATSNDTWITIEYGSTGIGDDIVFYSLTENTDTIERTGTIDFSDADGVTVATLTITQQAAVVAACTYTISEMNQAFGPAGGSDSVSVTAGSECSWTASASDSWIEVPTSFLAGTGNGTISYGVSENTDTAGRTGTISILNAEGSTVATVTVTQEASVVVACTYTISPTSNSFYSSGGTGSVSVTADSGCDWTADSNDSWITTMTSGSSGSGDGTVNYSVLKNTGTGPRTGTMTIAENTFTVTQEGSDTDTECTYTISPTSNSFDSSGGTGSVSVTADNGCDWTVDINDSWITTMTSGSSGSGDGTVIYSVSENTGTGPRTGTMTIAENAFTVTQEGSDDNGNDNDHDGISDDIDNCPDDYNPGQADFDEDGIGDACDDNNDNGGLSAPTNFSSSIDDCTTSIFGSSCNVSLSWTDVIEASGYRLYYGFSSGSYGAPVDLGNDTSVTFDGVPEGTYYLAISAYDSNGNEGNRSDELVFMVGESSIHTNFYAIVGDCIDDIFGNTYCTVSLSWTGVSGPSGYNLYYGSSSGNYAGSVDIGNVTSLSFTGIVEGIYYLALTSYDSGGVESGFSDELTLEVGPD